MNKSQNFTENGWINLNKQKNITSAGLIRQIKKDLKHLKIGHAGTLDPIATGVLPIAIGEATKTIPYLQKQNKTYIFNVRWGFSTDTDDLTGNIISRSDIIPNDKDIENILLEFQGVIKQKPPIFSAKKIKGRRAYEIARLGEIFELDEKEVYVKEIKMIEKINKDEFIFTLTCGSGTYVRAIARDIAIRLQSCCHVTKIDRTSYGPFNNKNYLSIDRLLPSNRDIDNLGLEIKPIQTVLDDILAVEINDQEAKKLKQGMPIIPRKDILLENTDKVYTLYADRIVAICNNKNGILHPERVFNY